MIIRLVTNHHIHIVLAIYMPPVTQLLECVCEVANVRLAQHAVRGSVLTIVGVGERGTSCLIQSDGIGAGNLEVLSDTNLSKTIGCGRVALATQLVQNLILQCVAVTQQRTTDAHPSTVLATVVIHGEAVLVHHLVALCIAQIQVIDRSYLTGSGKDVAT